MKLLALHQMGLAHGDLKPGNIVVNDDFLCFLIDFGRTREGKETAHG